MLCFISEVSAGLKQKIEKKRKKRKEREEEEKERRVSSPLGLTI